MPLLPADAAPSAKSHHVRVYRGPESNGPPERGGPLILGTPDASRQEGGCHVEIVPNAAAGLSAVMDDLADLALDDLVAEYEGLTTHLAVEVSRGS